MSVTGGADISLMNSSNADQGNSFSSGDSLNFSGSGELDNGMVVTSNIEIDGGNEDDRSVVIEFPEMGTLKFQKVVTLQCLQLTMLCRQHTTLLGMYWYTTTAPATGQATKEAPVGGFTTDNNFFYTAPEMVEGLGVNVSYTPSGTSDQTDLSYALAYTGVDGLTIGYAADDNGKIT